MILDKQFIFIIGSPRSGTSWLQLMIGAHPSVCTTIELTLFDKYVASWLQAWKEEAANIEQGRWNKGLPFLWTEDEFYGFLKGFLEKIYERVVATNPQATHILDKNPSYSTQVETIQQFLPNARFIHIIRDGRDVAVSMMAARRQIGFGPATVSSAAKMWKKCVRAAQEDGRYSDQYLEVRYENLSTATVDVLKSVLDFCDVPASVEDVAAIVETYTFEKMKASRIGPTGKIKVKEGHYRKGKIGSWKEELDPVQRYLFDKIAGDLLRELGYAKHRWWAGSGIQRFTLPAHALISAGLERDRSGLAAFLGPSLTRYVKILVMGNSER